MHSRSTGGRIRRTLAGRWRFRLDPENRGVEEAWFDEELDEEVQLPGTTDENEKGEPAGAEREQDHLTRSWSYEGVAWYQRDVTIPASWDGKRVELSLERTRETDVWLDDVRVGSAESLSTPQRFDLTDACSPGEHVLTVRVDNAGQVLSHDGVGRSHAATEHTQTNWNGILGRIELRATDPVWLEDARVYPDADTGTAAVRATVGNRTGSPVDGKVTVRATSDGGDRAGPETLNVEIADDRGTAETVVESTLDLGDSVLWDEFSPTTYELDATLEATDDAGVAYADERSADFGVRSFAAEGTQFSVNGRTTFLRGNVDCCVFPETGYAPTTEGPWREVFETAREYGLNHWRFHSWCPPEAAFAAADELGIYLQPELPIWSHSAFEDDDAFGFFRREAERILDAYGDHPSFAMFALGNELSGDRERMAEIVSACRERDPRHLYAQGSYNFLSDGTLAPDDDYWTTAVVPDPDGEGILRVRGSAAELADRDGEPTSTTVDYRAAVESVPVPILAHEIGQYQVHPDFEELRKYRGVLEPRNVESMRDRLELQDLEGKAEEFAAASGALTARCYREEVEAALRTPGFGGFQLLDLQDFPGQGTALVGILDAFYDSKGLIEPHEWRTFCAPVVVLARLERRTLTTDETLRAAVRLANYGPEGFADVTARWRLVTDDGAVVAEGTLDAVDAPQGELADLGTVEIDPPGIDAPGAYRLELSVPAAGVRNGYDLWVYPPADPEVPAGVTVARAFDEAAREALADGEDVLLLPTGSPRRHSVGGSFAPNFWNYRMFRAKAAAGTLGLRPDPDHPLFEAFPTDAHSDWQWWSLAEHARPVILDDAPVEFEPIVRAIDTPHRSHRLGVVFEASVDGGNLLVCSIDLEAVAGDPAVDAFRESLFRYVGADAFDPDGSISTAVLGKLLGP